jgi:hypothetical protein
MEHDLGRRNLLWGLALFGLFLALALGTVLVALIWISVD